MANEAQRRVVILYEHALLGEGIAKYLRDQTGVEATVGSSHHREEVRTALALGPAVVIFESSDPFERPDLSALPPDTVLIDVSAVIRRIDMLAESQQRKRVRIQVSHTSPPIGFASSAGCVGYDF